MTPAGPVLEGKRTRKLTSKMQEMQENMNLLNI